MNDLIDYVGNQLLIFNSFLGITQFQIHLYVYLFTKESCN